MCFAPKSGYIAYVSLIEALVRGLNQWLIYLALFGSDTTFLLSIEITPSLKKNKKQKHLFKYGVLSKFDALWT